MPALPTPSYPNTLPIHERRAEILQALRAHQVVVIAGETGSGKTTQLPKFLLECGLGEKGWIGCTQPRRVAALSVAKRIAEELGVAYGGPVGSKIRFTDATRDDTVVKVMTDGILLNELQEDPMLRRYEAIVIDEAHERSLNIDFILGCLRNLLRHRSDLKIVITSATIDTGSFAKAFNDAPVIEVSGRMFPVELHYRPIDALAGERRDFDYLDGAAAVVEEIVRENRAGDILVFLPGERDINELRRLLEDSDARQCDLLPLFGRLSSGDQQRIFQPGGRRRVILSTNIAETSLTVPGIRFVVDTGLARISRYSPHSRTQRLPIEPIARSSAEQRKGRCGRVSDGTCYRLYAEADYESRERFTTPEIHRSNLASVILRMMAFRLGDIRSFPFIDPPTEGAIVGGYRQLAELGAVTTDGDRERPENYQLTPLGRRLSRLPVDPTVARMLLEARQEGVVAEVLIIAAGLSIQDPRERPAEAAKEADAMHRQFIHPESDFLTLLNIWNAYHDKLDTLSQNKLRKFCKSHFLAYQRMREWRDIHHQLARALATVESKGREKTPEATAPGKQKAPGSGEQREERPATSAAGSPLGSHSAGYAAIHRSILSGLLSNVAVKEEAHNYRGPRNRKAMLFPGSGLFDHEAAKKQRKAAYAKKAKPKPPKTRAPDWIVCGEWMETGRLYARNAAKVEVDWIEAVAGDLLRIRHSEPFWSAKSAAALCKQRKLLFGLEIAQSQVSYTKIDPEEATSIFVRNGLVEEGIRERPDFLVHNATVREAAESEIARRQVGSAYLIEDALFAFYRNRLSGVGSFPELRRFAKHAHGGSLDFLKASLDDLLPESPTPDERDFPRELELGGHRLPLHYRNEPGSEWDGVTLQVTLSQLGLLQPGVLDWAVPGYLDEAIECLLRALPKPLRIQLHPLKERAVELRAKLSPSDRPLTEQLSERLNRDYQIQTYRDQWHTEAIPDRLRPRISVTNTNGDVLAEGRDLASLHRKLETKAEAVRAKDGLDTVPAWQRATARYERENLQAWDFGDLPEQIDLSGESGAPLKAYPALLATADGVHLRLLPDLEEARTATRAAWPLLGEVAMGRDIAWLQRELKSLKQLGTSLLPLGGYEALRPQAWDHIRRHLFHCGSPLPLRQSRFEETLARADRERRGIIPRLQDRLATLLEHRAAVEHLLAARKTKQALSYPGMRAQLEAIAPADLLRRYDFDELPDLCRFLQGMLRRAQRARASIQKDMEKAKRVAPFEAKLGALAQQAAKQRLIAAVKPYRLLLEEFKVSVFAQELGTGRKVSEKRLDALAAQIEDNLRRARL